MDYSYSVDDSTWEQGTAYEEARDQYIFNHQFTPADNKKNKERYRRAAVLFWSRKLNQPKQPKHVLKDLQVKAAPCRAWHFTKLYVDT